MIKFSCSISHLIFFILILLIFVSSGCHEKGCTDKAALNYNIAADEDDGTCKYCTSTHVQLSPGVDYILDNNPQSVYYGQFPVSFELRREADVKNYTDCGIVQCLGILEIKNRVAKEIEFNYSVYVQNPYYHSSNGTAIIPAFSSVMIDSIIVSGNYCDNANPPYIDATKTGYFIYH